MKKDYRSMYAAGNTLERRPQKRFASPFMSIAEVAERMHIKVEAVHYIMHHDQTFPHVRCGNLHRVPCKQFETWLKGRNI